MENFYKVLGLQENAGPDDIKKAYRTLAKQVHPDLGNGDAERFHLVNRAYQVLSDPDRRRDYDIAMRQYHSGAGSMDDYVSDVYEVSGQRLQEVFREVMSQTNLTRVRIKYQGRVIVDMPFLTATALTIAGFALAPFATILLNIGINSFFELEVRNVVMDKYEEASEAHQKGDLTGAENGYREVLEKSSFFVPARLNLGMLYRQLGESKKAEECFKEVLRMAPFGEIGNVARTNLQEIRGF